MTACPTCGAHHLRGADRVTLQTVRTGRYHRPCCPRRGAGPHYELPRDLIDPEIDHPCGVCRPDGVPAAR